MLVASLLLITSASVIYLLWAASSVPPSLLLLFFLVFQDSISYKYSTTQYNLLPLSVTRRRFQSQQDSTPELDVIAIIVQIAQIPWPRLFTQTKISVFPDQWD